ncbi:ThuA domain-containing protein [Nocardioides sp. C4-1]|uniref:ThuA domain-containing protein n=1 Tax=Nocardioides sp. C4-1 TaxID=3151851 RepID=UPI003266232E
MNHPVTGSNRRRRGLASGAALATALTVATVVAPSAATAADSTAPVLDAVSRTPVAAVPAYNGILNNTTWNPSTAPGLRDWFVDPEQKVTLSFSATDDTDVAKFVVTVGAAGTPVDVPAALADGKWTGSYDVVGAQNSVVTYTAVDSAGNASTPRTTTVKIDSTAPTAAWPGIIDGKIRHSAPYTEIKPVLADPAPGSGGPAIRDMWIDGERVDLVPLDLATLPVGGHTWAVLVGDAAGNQAKHTISFQVTTSFDELVALVDRYVADGRISAVNGEALKGRAQLAKERSTLGDTAGATAAMDEFAAWARDYAPRGVARTVLTGDAAYLKARLGGATDPAFTPGITVEAQPLAPRQPQVYAGPSVKNEDPDFKVLLFANRPGGFRHQHIPATMEFIQEQGAENNFDVDIWDYMAPNESVPGNPFESIENLRQYDALVAVSSVGNSQFITNRPSVADPAVLVDEQAILKQYVNEGGGFVAIHGATDSMHSWDWYKDLVGGEFDNHSSSVNGQQHNCEACRTTEVITEDGTNPTTDHFPRSIHVLDELYNWKTFLPRERVHVLQTLTEASYVGGLNAGDGRTEGADHPISWCRNWDGGRSYTQALMHNFELSDDPMFQEQILEAIRWTAGQTEANCVTHNEVGTLVTTAQASGQLAARPAAEAAAAVTASYNAYLAGDRVAALDRARAAQRVLQNASAGSGDSVTVLRQRATELVDWMSMLDETSPVLRLVSGPQDATAAVGSPASFTAEARGNDVEYQWQRQAPGSTQWVDLAGETTVGLRVVPTGLAENGTLYRVVVADASTEIVSDPARLEVVRGTSVVLVRAPATMRHGTASALAVGVITGGNERIDGPVSVQVGPVRLGTVQAVDGIARFALPARLPVGTHTVVARYAGTDDVAGAEARTTLVVQKAVTTTAARAGRATVKSGKPVKVTVAVRAAGITPAGTVVLYDGGKVVKRVKVVAGKATVTFRSNRVGVHRLKAAYTGSGVAEASTSQQVTVRVKRR